MPSHLVWCAFPRIIYGAEPCRGSAGAWLFLPILLKKAQMFGSQQTRKHSRHNSLYMLFRAYDMSPGSAVCRLANRGHSPLLPHICRSGLLRYITRFSGLLSGKPGTQPLCFPIYAAPGCVQYTIFSAHAQQHKRIDSIKIFINVAFPQHTNRQHHRLPL